MTTVFGIKHPDVESAIIVADTQTTIGDPQSGAPLGKYLGRKLWISEDGKYCFGHSGALTPETEEFVKKLRSGKFNIEKVIKKGDFPELRQLNLDGMGRREPNYDKISGFILATRFNNQPKIYKLHPLGEVEQPEQLTYMGSGSDKIKDYLAAYRILSQARDYKNQNTKMTMNDIICHGLEAVRRSQSQDIHSQGLDMLICTPDGIKDHYNDLGDDFGKKLKKICRIYKK